MNRRELTQFAKMAQKAIGLSDWRIDFLFSGTCPEDMNPYETNESGTSPDALGRVSMFMEKKWARVWVTTNEIEEGRGTREEVIIHELLHIKVDDAGMDIGDWREEAFINSLAPIILKALET